MTGVGEEDGFFDALANGPVPATDPAANRESVKIYRHKAFTPGQQHKTDRDSITVSTRSCLRRPQEPVCALPPLRRAETCDRQWCGTRQPAPKT